MTQVRPLRAYAEVALGRQRSPKHASGPHMTRYLRAANVKDGFLDLGDVGEMNFDPKERETFALLPGDVLVTEGSGSLGAVGASAVWASDLEGTVCFQNTLLRLRPRPSTDGRYLAWWCRHAFADGLFASIATGANIFHISAERVRSLPMTYLPLPAQRAIADYLDAETARIDALITKKRRLIELLDERWITLLETVIEDASGEEAVLGRACIGIAQGESPQAGGRPAGPDEMGILKLSAVRRGEYRPAENKVLDEDYVSTRSIVPSAGDLLVTRANTPQLVGDVCAVVDPEPSVILCDLIYRVQLDPSRLRSEFAAYSLLTRGARAHLSGSARGTSQSMVKVRGEDIRSCQVRFPALNIQDRAIRELNDAKSRRTQAAVALQSQINLLIERRQALITAAVTGELEIPGVAA